MRILCSSDLHLGRSSLLPPEHTANTDYTAAAAWQRTVRLALQAQVDLVLIAGDLVDQDNNASRASSPLYQGLAALNAARIPVVATAGNHDHAILPSLVDTFSGLSFDFLGRNGEWTQRQFSLNGQQLEVLGWSFPSSTVSECPVSKVPPPLPGSTQRIGLVHGEVGKSCSQITPLPLSQLQNADIDLWLAGHYHSPAWYPGRRGLADVLIPGSPQALGPGAEGIHGPWLAHWQRETRPQLHQVPLSTIRYNSVPLEVTGLSPQQCAAHVPELLQTCLHAAWHEDPAQIFAHLVCRIVLTGRHHTPQRVQEAVAEATKSCSAEQNGRSGGVGTVISRIQTATQREKASYLTG